MPKYAMGCQKSPFDIRTFRFTSSTKANVSGGKKWKPEDIEEQKNVGICTSISLTSNARKALGKKFSADFQYLCQKKFYDNPAYPTWTWGEGSSIFHALKVAKNIGFLPEEEWKHTTLADRNLPYYQYIEKLKSIPDSEIERLKTIASKYKISAYEAISIIRDSLANAIDASRAGILARYDCGSEWWTAPIEPLRNPKVVISGHAVSDTNYNGGSFRIANSWGSDWADGGTAYRLQAEYKPTEAWIVYYNELPKEVEEKIENRETILGKIMDLIQQLVGLVIKLANL